MKNEGTTSRFLNFPKSETEQVEKFCMKSKTAPQFQLQTHLPIFCTKSVPLVEIIMCGFII